ncbi:MAG: TlpA family protein disulfide reductase [Sphingobacteriales bacterium]|nr:MAG: TlpA family protein disulfide reductase [Sphingobacteriales bacterium]
MFTCNFQKKLLALLIVFSFSLNQSSAQDAKKLPSINVTNMKGEKVDISTLVGKGNIVVIDFWATWCVPCKKELNNISEIYPEWKEKYKVEFIAVSIDDSKNSAKVKTTVDGSGWPFTIMLDPNQDLMHALNFQAPPYTLVIDQAGNIVETHTGYVDGDEFLLEEKIKELFGK